MEIVEFDTPSVVYGLQVRTSDKAENLITSAELPVLWHDVSTELYPGPKRPPLYAVYNDYANKQDGEYTVTIGAKIPTTIDSLDEVKHSQVEIQAGRYLLFTKIGKLAETTIKLWIQAWEYFDQPDCPYERAYSSDFEEYEHYDPDNTEVKLYVGIK